MHCAVHSACLKFCGLAGQDLFNILACDWCFEIFNILFKILVVVHRGTAMVTIRRVISFWEQRARSSEAVR